MSREQWFQIEVTNEAVMLFLLSFISSLDFKPLFVPTEVNLRSVYRDWFSSIKHCHGNIVSLFVNIPFFVCVFVLGCT